MPLDYPEGVSRDKVLNILFEQNASLARLEGKVDSLLLDQRNAREARIALTTRVGLLERTASATKATVASYAALGAGVVTVLVNLALQYVHP